MCAFLTACGGGSSDNSTVTTDSEIKTNYEFTEGKLNTLLEEVDKVQKSVNLTYEGETYSKIIAAPFPSEDEVTFLYIILENTNGDKEIGLKLLEPSTDDASIENCLVGFANQTNNDSFSCKESDYSQSENIMTLSGTTLKENKPISLSVDLDYLEEVISLGSTKLVTTLQADGSMIVSTQNWLTPYITPLNIGPDSNNNIGSSLGATTYQQLKKATQNPIWPDGNVTLQFSSHILGSTDDDINMYTGLLIREKAMNTLIDTSSPDGATVASGGTDLFSAGVKRQVKLNTPDETLANTNVIGVHSWSTDDKEATEIPYTDEAHIKQATYFNQMLGDKGVSFYIFSIKSAPASSIYYVTNAESELYNLVTDINYQ